jgi:basic amino acid/polyamine antiporter, APA family
VGAVVLVATLLVDLRGAIGSSSFTVLTYYAIASASVWTQPPEQRRWPRWLNVAGVIGCVALAATFRSPPWCWASPCWPWASRSD